MRRLSIGVLLVASSLVAPAQAQDSRALAAQVRAYIERFEHETAALVADERYWQWFTPRLGSASSRQLRSDYVLIKPADNQPWLGFRDVFEVDGKPVRERDSRMLRILEETAPDSLARAAALVREGSRFNLGPERTVNTPMMPLQLLSKEHAGRIRVRVSRIDRNAGRATLTFDEPNRPTIVRTPDGETVWSRGEVTIRLTDAAVLSASLRFRFATARQRDESTMSVEYAEVPGIAVPVPARMTEQLATPGGSARGEAAYSNYRRFQTSTRIR